MPPSHDPFEVVDLTDDLSEHAHVPASPGEARAVAATLASRLSAQARRLDAGVARLVESERRVGAQLGELQDATVALAHAGGVEVDLRPRVEQVRTDDALHPAVIEAEEILREQRRRLGRARQDRGRGGRWSGRVTFTLSFAAFLGLGYLCTVLGGSIPGDAISRVGSGQAVVWSRDPHLEAIGFIWGPFPTLFQLPLIALRRLWLPMTSEGIAAIVVSAAFMAGSMVQLLAWGRECGAGRVARVLTLLLVAAHPLIWTHGANGMSEACWLFFLLLCLRHLARWTETDDTRSLVVVGVAIGMAYLTRYESVAVAAAVFGYVAAVSWMRRSGNGDEPRSDLTRRRELILDVAIVAFPAVVAMCAWAGASWAIVGEPFPQFTSEYGNSALVRRSAADTILLIGDPSAVGRAWFYVRQLVVAVPLLPLVGLASLWGSRRSVLRATAAFAVLGAPVVLQLLFAARGSTFPWLRYVVVGVAFLAVLVLVVAGHERALGRRALTVAALLALVPGIWWTLAVVRADDLGSFDQTDTVAALESTLRGATPTAETSLLVQGQQAAAEIDALEGVEPGTVLMDQASLWVLHAAPRPEVYIVPSDRDFLPALNDPEQFGVRYVLMLSAAGADQVSALYPDMWDGGGAVDVELVAEWGDEDDPKTHMRLFRLEDPDPRNRAKPDPEFGR